jgi:hypothetical protein
MNSKGRLASVLITHTDMDREFLFYLLIFTTQVETEYQNARVGSIVEENDIPHWLLVQQCNLFPDIPNKTYLFDGRRLLTFHHAKLCLDQCCILFPR